jgi:tetratricopeptide (TPR) repeat protein
MPNRSTDALFVLVKSLERGEKRNFKLYASRNYASADELKVVQLFDAIDKMDAYDEALLLKKNKGIKKQQLSNLKAQLFRQILGSLRLISYESNIDMVLHEQMDHARILYNKGMYYQSLKILDKTKELARQHNQYTFLQQALFFEKKIEALYITRSMQDRADQLSQEADVVNSTISLVSELSNLALQLYSWYIKHGHSRNEKEAAEAQEYFNQRLGDKAIKCNTFYEKLYLYQSFCWNYFIKQDFPQYYRYAQKWVNLFDEAPFMIEVETGHYIKGMHNLMGAYFDLGKHDKLDETLQLFEKFAESAIVQRNINARVQCFTYKTISRFNKHFLEGSFSKGLEMVPEIEKSLKEFELYVDRHRILVFYYKIACLYFGSGDYEKTIDYLNRIINWKVDLRTDLQCYARLLHLIAHYELGNEQILDHLIKSVYRFMAKMQNLSVVEEEIFRFLRRSFHVSVKNINPELEKLLIKLKALRGNRFETRAFAYLDIISWIESKLENIPVQEVLRKKFIENK